MKRKKWRQNSKEVFENGGKLKKKHWLGPICEILNSFHGKIFSVSGLHIIKLFLESVPIGCLWKTFAVVVNANEEQKWNFADAFSVDSSLSVGDYQRNGNVKLRKTVL